MDADGDGKVSAVDCAEQMAWLSSGTKMANHWRQRANAEWKAFKAQQAVLAAARAAAIKAAKAAALERKARMAMAQARVGASLAMKAAAAASARAEESKEFASDCASGVSLGLSGFGLVLGIVAVGAIVVGSGGTALLPVIAAAGWGGLACSAGGIAVAEFSASRGYISAESRDLAVGLGYFGLAVSGLGLGIPPTGATEGIAAAVGMQGVCAGTAGTALTAADWLAD